MGRSLFMSGRRRWLAAGLASSSLAVWPRWLQAGSSVRALRVVGPWEITGLDPSRAGYLFSRHGVSETLLDIAEDGNPTPALATHWEVSADQRHWRFHLRPQARFHDGSPVTPQAVAAALQFARRKPGGMGLVPLEAIDAGTDVVDVHLAADFAALPAVLAHSSAQILAPASYSTGGSVRRVIGSGPYQLTGIEPPQRFSLARSPHWDGPRPAIAAVDYLAVGRGESRALLAESGQADIVYGLDPASWQRLKRHARLQVHSVPLPRTIYLKLNAGHRWLAELPLRQAISLAIDRAGIAHAILRDPQAAASQLLPPALAQWHDADLPAMGQDIAVASQLLAAAGWRPAADGIRVRQGAKGGERLALTLRTFPDRPELPIIAAAVQEQLRQVGIAVEVLLGNASDVPAAHRQGTLELALGARGYGIYADPMVTLLQDFGPEGGDWGAMNWGNQTVPAALAALQGPLRERDRHALRRTVTRTLHEELPVIPIAWNLLAAAVHPALRGFTLDPLERSYRLERLSWGEA